MIYAVLRDKSVFKSWTIFTAGVGSLAAVFAIFTLSRASVSELAAAIPNMLTDPEHLPKPMLAAIKDYFCTIKNAFPHGVELLLIYGFITVMMISDKHRYERKMFYVAASSVIAALMVCGLVPEVKTDTYNHIMLPMAFAGLTAYIVTEHRNSRIFLFMFLGGIVYSVSIFFSSNQHIYAISMAFAAVNVGSIILIGNAVRATRYGIITRLRS